MITVEFSEVVIVDTSGGTPSLQLETGTNDQEVNYSSGSNTNTLVFNYVVAEGDLSSDLALKSTSALSTNGGTIRDSAGNDASLALPSPGSRDSLSFNKSLIVDGIAPVLSTPAPINIDENAANNHQLHNFNDLSGGDTDENGDSLTYSIQSGNTHNIFAIGSSNGMLTIQDNSSLDHDTASQYILSIQASDGVNTSSTSATINVIDVNNSPVAVNDAISVNENATATQNNAPSKNSCGNPK